MQELPADVVPRPAASERSPNRKPRYRRGRRNQLVKDEIYHLKRLWLRLYRACGNQKIACERVGRAQRAIEGWCDFDPEFRSARKKIRQGWNEFLEMKFTALGEKAVNTVESILDGVHVSPEIKLKASMAVLKSQGIGVEQVKTFVEHSGPGGGPIPITGITVMLQPQRELPSPDAIEGEFTETDSVEDE